MPGKLATVILAAGQGTRMKSDLPKVLHRVAGKAMLAHVVETAVALQATPVIPVVGHGAEQVRVALPGQDLHFVLQAEQLGTGHALLCAEQALKSFSGDLLLLCGDVPLLQKKTLQALIDHHRQQAACVTILTAEMDNPTGYGRIIRGAGGVDRIVEEKDATDSEREVREINTGIYLFQAPQVFSLLRVVDNLNAQGEYYLTDVVAAARQAGELVEVFDLARDRQVRRVQIGRQIIQVRFTDHVVDCQVVRRRAF